MKYNLNLNKYAFLFIGLLLFHQSIAQKDFQDGFVITTRKDTLVGKLSNIHKNSHNYIDFMFPNGSDTVFTPNHILSYEMGNQRYIVVPMPHPTKKDTLYLFARVLVDGYASLYKTKLKLDPITAAEEAYLCKKYNEDRFYPAGRIKSLAIFFNDHPFLENELKNHPHLYANDVETKEQLFNHYNAWKRHQMDSISAINRPTNVKVDKRLLEVFMADSTNLVPESKYELDKITGKLSAEPNLTMAIEFVNTSANPRFERQAMKAVLLHLNEYDARIDESTVTVPENQQLVPSRPNGQLVYYYFR